MSEHDVFVKGSQILDVVVYRNTLTIYLLGGESQGELESGGVSVEMYDIQLSFLTEQDLLSCREQLVVWYRESNAVTVIAEEGGAAYLLNEDTDESLRVTYGDEI